MSVEEINEAFSDIVINGNVPYEKFQLLVSTIKVNNKQIEQLQQENKELKDNWNELKEYINEEIDYSTKMDFKVRQTSAIYFLQEMEKLGGDK